MVIWDSIRQWWYSTIFDNSLRTDTIYGICTLLSSYCFIDYSRYCFRKDRRGKRYKSSPPCCLLGCSCHVPYKLCWLPLWGKCRLKFLQIILRCIEHIFIRKVRFIDHPIQIISWDFAPERAFIFAKFAHIENRWM